jgi:hypothetical protein
MTSETSIDQFIARELPSDSPQANDFNKLFQGNLGLLASPPTVGPEIGPETGLGADNVAAAKEPTLGESSFGESAFGQPALEGPSESFFCEPFDPALDQPSGLEITDSKDEPIDLSKNSLESPSSAGFQRPPEERAPFELGSTLDNDSFDLGQSQPQPLEDGLEGLDGLPAQSEPGPEAEAIAPEGGQDFGPLELGPQDEAGQSGSFDGQAEFAPADLNQDALGLEGQGDGGSYWQGREMGDERGDEQGDERGDEYGPGFDDEIVEGQPILGDGEADGSTFFTPNPPLALDDPEDFAPGGDLEPSPMEPGGEIGFGPDPPKSSDPSGLVSDDQGAHQDGLVIDGYRFDPHAQDELDDETPAVFDNPAMEGNDFLDQLRANLFGEGEERDSAAFGMQASDEHLAVLDEPGYDPVNDPAGTSTRTQPLSDLPDAVPTLHSSPPPEADEVSEDPESEPFGSEPFAADPSVSDRDAADPSVVDPSLLAPALGLGSQQEDELDFSGVLEPSLEPQIATNIPPALPPQILYTPPRPVPKVISPEASTAVIVNYLEDTDDSMLASQGKVDELAEDEDMDIDLMDMHSQEPLRIEARPMIPVPKTNS